MDEYTKYTNLGAALAMPQNDREGGATTSAWKPGAMQQMDGNMAPGALQGRDKGHIYRAITGVIQISGVLGQHLIALDAELARLMGIHVRAVDKGDAERPTTVGPDRPCQVEALALSIQGLYGHTTRLGELVQRLREL